MIGQGSGHAEAAAGIAGLIKAALILRHGVIPASLHLEERHTLLAQDGFPVRVVTRNHFPVRAPASEQLTPACQVGGDLFLCEAYVGQKIDHTIL
ncbi:hypothetical protein [Streptomyces sp. 8N616]|uniref:hypothetical protein n=1 Tax=Streptomyces sp. 8N616 TaxID=3457414 RepID=UPI003FD144A7